MLNNHPSQKALSYELVSTMYVKITLAHEHDICVITPTRLHIPHQGYNSSASCNIIHYLGQQVRPTLKNRHTYHATKHQFTAMILDIVLFSFFA